MKMVSVTKMGTVHKQGRAQIIVLALVSFLVGVMTTTFWFRLMTPRVPPDASSETAPPPSQQSVATPSSAAPPAKPFVQPKVPVPQSAVDEVKRALPNYASLSVEQGTEILRQAALEKFAAAAQELQSEVTAAQDELKQAQGETPADQQAAMKHLQQVQSAQSQKLQEIAGQLQTQIAALNQLKAQDK